MRVFHASGLPPEASAASGPRVNPDSRKVMLFPYPILSIFALFHSLAEEKIPGNPNGKKEKRLAALPADFRGRRKRNPAFEKIRGVTDEKTVANRLGKNRKRLAGAKSGGKNLPVARFPNGGKTVETLGFYR